MHLFILCTCTCLMFGYCIINSPAGEGNSTCTDDIPHGKIPWWCKKFGTDSCHFSCDEGYQRNGVSPAVKCTRAGTWIGIGSFHGFREDELCTRKPLIDIFT